MPNLFQKLENNNLIHTGIIFIPEVIERETYNRLYDWQGKWEWEQNWTAFKNNYKINFKFLENLEDIDVSNETICLWFFRERPDTAEYRKYCRDNNVEQLIHLSALGVEKAIDSKYAKSKLDGESALKKNFEKTTIIRPSVVFSVDDNFTTQFMTMLNILPFFPLYYKGQTKFQPIFCSDLTNIIFEIIIKKISAEIIECAGPEILTFENIINELLKLIEKRRLLVPLPNFIGKYSSIFLGYFPKPIITLDQFKILKYDNIFSDKNKNQKNFNLDSTSYFSKEVKKYAYMWRDGGQFSKSPFKKN